MVAFDLQTLTPTVCTTWEVEPDFSRFEHLKLVKFVRRNDPTPLQYARAAEWAYAVQQALQPYQPRCAEAVADFIIHTIGMEHSFTVFKEWAQFREETLRERLDLAPVRARPVFTESEGESLSVKEYGNIPYHLVMRMCFGDEWRNGARFSMFRVSPDEFGNDHDWANCVTLLGIMVDERFDVDSLLLGWKQPWYTLNPEPFNLVT